MSAQDADEAAAWVIRLDRDDLPAGVHREFEAWLRGGELRRGAFDRAQAAWVMLDRAHAVRAGSRPAARSNPWRARRVPLFVGAAGLAAAAAIAGLFLLSPTATYTTGPLQMSRVYLADGSVVLMNANGLLRTRLGIWSRKVTLVKGQALFKVAKDPNRPFVVSTGRAELTAVGTAFSVDKGANGTELLVTEGVVEAKAAGGPVRAIRVAAGSTAHFGTDGRIWSTVATQSDLDDLAAWQDGQIALHGETLAEAVRRFNRFNQRTLVIKTPALADSRIVGWFRINDPDAFARAVAVIIGAKVVVQDNQVVLMAPSRNEKNKRRPQGI